jgi:hypothetical protein
MEDGGMKKGQEPFLSGVGWRFLGSLFIVIFLSFWWGVPTFNKWRADKMVDDLCSKDGGVKVYESTSLPSTMFNEYGQPKIRFVAKTGADKNISETGLYFSTEQFDIVGNPNAGDISKLVVWKSKIQLRRSSDGRVLGETVMYARRGGDAFGPWHPSSYSCPNNASEWTLASKVVSKGN